jgi:cysteine desulfurase family protein
LKGVEPEMIYFDNAATTYPKPCGVYDEIMRVMKKAGGNAGRGGHRLANGAADAVFTARQRISDLFNISDPSRVCFVSGATAGLNFAVKGVLMNNPGNVIISDMEHNSVLRPVHSMSLKGVEYKSISSEKICKSITTDTSLVVVNHASNVTGELADIKSIGEAARKNGSVFVVDASQSAGHIEIDVERDNIDILVAAGHKGLFGPQGTGIMYVREGIELETVIEGGTGSMSELFSQPDIYPDKFEAGTVNAPGIAGLGAGVKFILKTGVSKIHRYESELANMLVSELEKINGVTVYKPHTNRVGVVSFNIEDYDSAAASTELNDRYGIMVRGGLHCAYLAHKKLNTLETGCIRASLSYFNTKNEVQKFINAIDRMV